MHVTFWNLTNQIRSCRHKPMRSSWLWDRRSRWLIRWLFKHRKPVVTVHTVVRTLRSLRTRTSGRSRLVTVCAAQWYVTRFSSWKLHFHQLISVAVVNKGVGFKIFDLNCMSLCLCAPHFSRVHLCLNVVAATVTIVPPNAPPTSRCPTSALESRFCPFFLHLFYQYYSLPILSFPSSTFWLNFLLYFYCYSLPTLLDYRCLLLLT